ncbi:uncharacterized protein PSFLO_04073 [Pseudozyma flocculosa]|uniref:Uncharacterized protein n=1 Tax=Pseudozyma flocculosa TaxID=84751 RepID=A0A5C3F3N9_9BASI|nr:uncharacterized protein PSFLO_04073 [Pseudozyma flocculosa]
MSGHGKACMLLVVHREPACHELVAIGHKAIKQAVRWEGNPTSKQRFRLARARVAAHYDVLFGEVQRQALRTGRGRPVSARGKSFEAGARQGNLAVHDDDARLSQGRPGISGEDRPASRLNFSLGPTEGPEQADIQAGGQRRQGKKGFAADDARLPNPEEAGRQPCPSPVAWLFFWRRERACVCLSSHRPPGQAARPDPRSLVPRRRPAQANIGRAARQSQEAGGRAGEAGTEQASQGRTKPSQPAGCSMRLRDPLVFKTRPAMASCHPPTTIRVLRSPPAPPSLSPHSVLLLTLPGSLHALRIEHGPALHLGPPRTCAQPPASST